MKGTIKQRSPGSWEQERDEAREVARGYLGALRITLRQQKDCNEKGFEDEYRLYPWLRDA